MSAPMFCPPEVISQVAALVSGRTSVVACAIEPHVKSLYPPRSDLHRRCVGRALRELGWHRRSLGDLLGTWTWVRP